MLGSIPRSFTQQLIRDGVLAYSPYDHSVNGYEVSWTSVELNGSNELVVTVTGDAGKRAAFGMMRIEAVASVGQPAVLFIIK